MQNEAPISTDEETARQVPVRKSEAAAALTGGGGSMSRRHRGGDLNACWSATAFDKKLDESAPRTLRRVPGSCFQSLRSFLSPLLCEDCVSAAGSAAYCDILCQLLQQVLL